MDQVPQEFFPGSASINLIPGSSVCINTAAVGNRPKLFLIIGAGRRLRGPEPDDDSVCEDPPEFLEGERPRPQGSSPVNEYPVTEKYTDIDKQREEEIYDPYQKSSGSKKGRFGSFFEKRSSAKMSREESPELGVIVKTAKEVCAEGLVVSGGGREGIFIKEVKAESPAAKHLNVQEGDQILSATVYFDNVSYEDALQILEHAQPYKMEFCLKRKPLGPSALESSTAERQEVAPGEEGASSVNRERVKTQRRNDARISWPKFPSFTRGRKAHFKRSHSTSEAEEQRKLEMSPTTSDTESPIKSQDAVKDKTKKQKIKLSRLKMKGPKSKSVEHEDKDSVPVSRSLENVKTQQTDGVSGMHSQQKKESMSGETPQIYVLDEPEKKGTTRIRNEYTFLDVTGPETEISQHRAELISLDNTLKTTDISDFLIDRGRVSTKKSPEVKKKKKKERSELKVNIQGKEKGASTPESLLKSPKTLILKTSSDSLKTPEIGARTQDLSGNIMSPNVISQTELKGRQIAIDIDTQRIDQNKSISKVGKESSEKKVISTTTVKGDMDTCLPKVDVSLDMSDVGLLKKSPKKEFEKHKKERSILILDSERYGIRTRSPIGDISTTKTYLGSSGNGTNLSSSKGSKPKSPKMITSLPSVKVQDIPADKKDASLKMETVLDIQTPQLVIQASKPQTETNIDDVIGEIGTQTVPKFKMPKIEQTDFNVHEPIVMTEVEASTTKAEVKGPKDKMHKAELDSRKLYTTKQTDITIELLKREDIEIPGMETITAGNIQTTAIKLPEIGKMDATAPTVGIQAKKIQTVMKADEIKEAKSKVDMLTFKLPKVGISGLDVHQQIKKSDMTEKVKLDLTADVSQPGTPEIRAKRQDIDVAIVPMMIQTPPDMTDSHLGIQSSEHSREIGMHYTTEEMSKKIIPMYKLPKIEPLDLDAREPISITQVSFSKAEVQDSKIEGKLPRAEVAGGMLEISTSHFEMGKAEKPEIKLPKLPKREDIEIPGMEATSIEGNIQMTAIKLPEMTKKDASVSSVEIQAKQIQPEICVDNIKEAISNINLPTFRLPKIDFSGTDVHEQIIQTDVNTEMAKDPKSGGKDQILDADIKCKDISESKFKIPPMPDFDVSFPNLKADVKLGKERETGEMKCISDTQVIAAGSDINADFKSSLTELSQIKDLKGELGTAATNTQVSDKKQKKSKQKVSIPTFGITKPDIRFPEAEVQISLLKGKVDVKVPELDKASEIEAIEKSDSQSIKMAKICLSTPTQEVEALDASMDIDVTKRSVPLAGVDTELLDVSIKGQNIEMEIPECKMGLQKVKMPDITELELSGKSPVICIKSPGVAIERSVDDVNAAGKIIKQERQGFKLPKSGISFSNLKGPGVDISISKPGVDILFSEAEVDTKILSVEVEKPPAEEKFKMPDIDIKEVDLKVKDPTISVPKVKAETPVVKQMKTPSLEISKPEKKSPQLTGHIIIPSAKVCLTEPDTVIMGPEISAGETSVDVKVPELKMSRATVSAGIKSTSVEVEGLPFNMDTDGKGVKLEKQGSKFKVPTFGILSLKEKGSGVDISTLKPDVDISLSEGTIEAQLSSLEVERTSVEGKLKEPAIDIKGIDLTVKKPQVSVQKLRKSPKVTKSTPEVTGVVTIPELEIQSGNVGMEAPEIDIKGPKVDIEKPEDNIELPEVKMPDITVALPKIKGPTIDLKPTQIESKTNISKTDVDIKAPDVYIKPPSLEIHADISESEGTKGKFKMPRVKMPSFGISKPELKGSTLDTDVSISKPDINIKGAEISGSGMPIDVNVPQCELTVSRDTPAADIESHCVDVGSPKVDVQMDKELVIEGQESRSKLPKFEISLPKVKRSAVDINTSKPNADISLPEVDVEANLPTVEFKRPSVEGKAEISDIDAKGIDVKIKIPKISLPKFGFSKPEIKTEIDASFPKGDVSPTKRTMDVKGPEMNIKASEFQAEMDISGSPKTFKLPTIKFPKVGISGTKSKIETSDVKTEIIVPEVKTPSKKVGVDIEVPNIHIDRSLELDKPKSKTELIKIKIPDIDVSLPKVKDQEVSLKTPKAEIDVSVPVSEISSESPFLGNVTAEIESGGKAKFHMPHIKIPSFGISKLEQKGPKASGDMSLPEISLKKQDTHVKGPEVRIDGTSIDINTQEPKLTLSGKTSAVDVKGPVVDINMKGKEVDLKAPSLDGHAEIPDIEAGAGQHGKFKIPHIKMPSFGFSKPEISGPKTSGDIHLPSVDISVTKPDSGINVPDISANVPSDGVKLPKPELSVSGETPAVDIKGPDVDIDMKGKEVELEGQGSKFKLPKFGISFPKVKGPGVDISASKADVDISFPEVTAEAQLPVVEVEGPSVEGKLDTPEVNSTEVDVKVKKPSISFPKFGFSKADIKAPEIDVSLPEGNISVPEMVDMKAPEIDIKSAETQANIDIEGSPSKFKLPTIKLPKFGITAPKIKADLNEVNAEITVPEIEASSGKVDIDRDGPALDIEKQESKFELPKVKIPKTDFSISKSKGPQLQEIHKAESEICVPETNIGTKESKVGLKEPSFDGQAEIPEIEAGTGQHGKFKMPHIKMPSFGFSKHEISGPKISGEVHLPSVDISVTKPDTGIKVPDINADLSSAGVKLKEPELSVSGETPAVDIKGPDVDIDTKRKEVELEGQGSTFKLPKFGISFPKVKGPGVDIRASKPDVDISSPEVTVEVQLPAVELERPSVERKVDIPELDTKEVDIKLKKPRISFPKFGYSKPDVKSPEIDISLPKVDISLTEGSVEVKKPEVDIKAPDVEAKEDADIKGSPSKFKLPTFKLPKFGITAPKVKAEAPGLSVDITVPEIEASIGKVDIDHDGPGMDIEKPDGTFEWPKLKMPDIDLSLPKTKGIENTQEIPKAESNILLPNTDIVLQEPALELKGPSLDGQAEIPDIKVGAEQHGKFKMPHIKIPSFGFSKPEISGPKTSGDINLPSVDISVTKPDSDIKVPDISADVPSDGVKLPKPELSVSGETPAVYIKGPDVDIDTKRKEVELEGQGSTFKLPKFGISFPKVKEPGVDISASKPDVDISSPEVTVEVQLPAVGLEGPSVERKVDIPELDTKEVDIKLKKPRISFPKFGFSKPDVKSPEIDISLPKVDISLTEGSVEVKEPEVDIKAPDEEAKENADIKGSPSKFKLPTFKLPKFGITAPKIKAEASGLSADITVPEIEASTGKVDIDHDGPGMDIEKPDGTFEWPKLKMPDIDFSLPKTKRIEINQEIPKAESNISVPNTDIVLQEPALELERPSLDGQAEIPDIEVGTGQHGKFKMPHIKMPSFGFSKPEISGPKTSGDINLPSVDISVTKPHTGIKVPDISADVPADGVKPPKPELSVSGETPAVDIKGYSVDVEGPDVDIDMKGKTIELEGQRSKFKLPRFGISLPKAKGPTVDISASKPDVHVSLPEVTLEAKLPGVEVEGSAVEGKVDIPEVEAKEADLKVKKPKISFPKFGFSKPDIKSPEIDVNLPKGDISFTEGSVEVKGPEVDIKAPEIQIETKDKGIDIVGSPTKFKLPTFKFPKFGISAPKVTAESPIINTDIKEPEIETSSRTLKVVAGAPIADIDGSSIELVKTKGKLELSKINMPDIDVSFPKAKGSEINLKTPKDEADISVSKPEIDIESSPLYVTAEMPVVEGRGKAKFELPQIKMPSFEISKPELKATIASGDMNIPSADISLTKPEINIKIPDIRADGTSLNIKPQEPELTLSRKTPTVDIKGPDLDVDSLSRNVDMKGKEVELDGQGSKVKLPKFGISFPKMKESSVEIRASKPDAGTLLPEEKIQIKLPDMKVVGPTIERKGDITEVAVKDSEVKMKRSRISFPKFGFSKPEIKSPEIDVNLPKVDASLPETMVDVKGPEIDIKSTETEAHIDADIGGSPSKFKLPTFKLPKFGITISKVKADLPEISADITEPQIEVSSGKVDIEYDGPGMDIEKPAGKFELPKLNMPDIDFSLPKTKEIEIHEAEPNLSEPKLELKKPSLDGQAEIRDIEVGAGQHGKFKMPHIKMPSFGFSKPEISGPTISGEIHLPSVDISVTKPSTDINVPDNSADLPSAGVKLKEPELSVLGETTDVDTKNYSVAVEGPDVKGIEMEGQSSKFKLPKFGISFPKAKGPGVDIQASKPDVDISLPEMTVEAQLPGVEVEGPSMEGKVDMPEMDAKEVDLKAKKSKIYFPKFGFSKPDVKTPEIDISLPKGDISLKEGSVEVKGPEVDSKAPETEIEIKDKDMDIIGSPTKFKLPTFKFPRFGISAPKVTAEPSNINSDITVPEIETSSKQYKVEVEAPTVKIDGSSIELDKSKGKIELPKIKMPDIDVSLEKAKGSGINLKTHKAEADMSVSKPGIDTESSCLDGTIKISETETGGKGKFQFPHIKVPSFGISKPEQKDSTISGDIHLPSVSLTNPGTNIKGQDIDMDGLSVHVKLPEPGLAISGETQSTDIKDPSIDFDGPSFDATMKGAEPEGQGSKFKLPKFGISFPKVKEPAVDISSSKPEVDMSLPGVTVEAKFPGVELEGPLVEGRIDIPEVDSKEVDLKVKKPRISLPKFGFSKQDVKAPELDVSLPKVDISLKEGSVEVKEPEVDVKAPETQIEIKDKDMDIVGSPTKFKLPTFKFPKFGTVAPKSKVKAQDVSADITVPEIEAPLSKVGVDVEAPDFQTEVLSIEIDKPEGIVKLPKLKVDMSATTLHESTDLSEMEGPELEVKVDISAPEPIKTEVETKGSPSKFKLPTFKMPRFGFSTAKAKTSDIDLDTGDTGLKIPEVTIEGKTFEIYKTNDGTSDVPGTEKKSELQVNTKEPQKSSKFNLPTIEDVFKGLDIEFNVPTLEEVDEPLAPSRKDISHTRAKEQSTHSTSAEKDSKLKHKSYTDPSEIQLSTSHPGPEVSIQALTITKETEAKERSKFKFRFPQLGFTESSEQGGNTDSINVVVEEKEKPQEEKETEHINEAASNTDKGTWFKFPKFGSTSPSKTIKDSDKKMSQPSEGIGKSVEGDIVEEDVSLTSSVRSSDAFADISSTMTSEQVGPSIVSPTKVKVKISEPIIMVGVGEVKVPSDIITSTARTELILLEPHLPEKIDTANVPVSAGATFPFPEELKQEPRGDIHVVTSNIQATPSSEHAKVITKVETHSVQALQGQSLTVKVGSAPWTTEGSGERLGKVSKEKILVEKHVVKEKSVEDKGTVIITQRVTQIVEADSGEPILGDAASAIKKLRDTMHSEKMKFFEDAETSTITVSTHKIETQVFDTSTEKK